MGASTLFTFYRGLAPMLFRLHNGRAYVIHIRSQARGYAILVTQWARLSCSHFVVGSRLCYSCSTMGAPTLFILAWARAYAIQVTH
jgi:hypothetical protein